MVELEKGEAVATDEWLPAAYAVELFCVVVAGMPTV